MLRSAFLFCRVTVPTALVLACAGAAGAQGVASLPGPAQSAPLQTVTVQVGDTAYAIARRVGLSVETLLALNHLPGPDIRVGQVLLVQDPYRHTVQPHETLYGLARRYGVSMDALLAENLLPVGTVLAVGQVLKVPASATRSGASAGSAAPVGASPTSSGPVSFNPAPSVQPSQPSAGGLNPLGGPGGLAQLAPPPVLSVPDAALSVLPVPGVPVPEAPAAPEWPVDPEVLPPLPADWRGAALALLGTPYVYGGTTRAGLDCSGFVLQVFTPLGVRLPRVSADQARVGLPVEAGQLQPGDLLFFDTEGRGRVSHVGIYLGDDTFVSANSYQGRVSIDTLMADRYWRPRYLGARRILNAPYAQQSP